MLNEINDINILRFNLLFKFYLIFNVYFTGNAVWIVLTTFSKYIFQIYCSFMTVALILKFNIQCLINFILKPIFSKVFNESYH